MILAFIVIPILATLFAKIYLRHWQTQIPTKRKKIKTTENYQNCYQAKYLLTKNEWYEYKKLQDIAKKYELNIFPKVRLLDIIEPQKGKKNYKTLLYKVQSKHIDFLICDKNLHIKAILELDDNSHNAKGRQKRDNFVDTILTDVGYKVIRTMSITEEILNNINIKTEKADQEKVQQ